MLAGKMACELSGWTNAVNVEILAAACEFADDYERAVDYERQAMNIEGLTEEERGAMLKILSHYDE